MKKTEKDVINEIIIDHMKIIRGLMEMIDPDVDYVSMAFIKHDNENEGDFYSFNARVNHEEIFKFDEFI